MLLSHHSSQASLSLATVLSVFIFDAFSSAAVGQENPANHVTPAAQPVDVADMILMLWPDKPLTWKAPNKPEFDRTTDKSNKIAGRHLIRLTHVSKPELHVFLPTIASSSTTVLIAPGGGYSILAWDLERTEIATWLQSVGITAIFLKYRVPTGQESERWLPAVQDVQRSISLIRSDGTLGVTTKSLGVLGFSAGGNATARVATATTRAYSAKDKIDEGNCVPDFVILIYPAWLMEQGITLIKDLNITPETPPMFLAHAANDAVTCLSSVALFAALKPKNVATKLHVFSRGGHGFDGHATGNPTDAWRPLCRTWSEQQDWLKS